MSDTEWYLSLSKRRIGHMGAEIAQRFFRYEGPTWLLAVCLYASWFALVWFHAALP